MKIVADENIPSVKDAFMEFGDVIIVPGREITREILKDVSILLVRSVTRVDQKLLEGTEVKFVAASSIGTDHIDKSYLSDNSIGFAGAPGSNADSVAEYIVSALLQIAHNMKFRVSERTLGIIGVGNIGSRVFKRAGILGMKCLLNDPPKKRMTKSDLYCSLDDLLSRSDIITIHVPLSKEGEDSTYHIVNSEFLSKMRQDTVLINTSRGKIIDEKQLCETYRDELGGLVLDVWDNEPAINLDLLKLADIATPHIAGYSYNGKINGTQMIYDSACDFFFRKKKWQSDKILKKLEHDIIDLSQSKNPIYDAVNYAYPIMDDHRNLNRIVKKEVGMGGAYFDELRKNYRRRLEFSHFSVKADNASRNEKEILAQLGFHIKE